MKRIGSSFGCILFLALFLSSVPLGSVRIPNSVDKNISSDNRASTLIPSDTTGFTDPYGNLTEKLKEIADNRNKTAGFLGEIYGGAIPDNSKIIEYLFNGGVNYNPSFADLYYGTAVARYARENANLSGAPIGLIKSPYISSEFYSEIYNFLVTHAVGIVNGSFIGGRSAVSFFSDSAAYYLSPPYAEFYFADALSEGYIYSDPEARSGYSPVESTVYAVLILDNTVGIEVLPVTLRNYIKNELISSFDPSAGGFCHRFGVFDGSVTAPDGPGAASLILTYYTLKALNILGFVPVGTIKDALVYFVLRLMNDNPLVPFSYGSFNESSYFGFHNIETLYYAVAVLKMLDALDRLDMTAVRSYLELVYDHNTGGFYTDYRRSLMFDTPSYAASVMGYTVALITGVAASSSVIDLTATLNYITEGINPINGVGFNRNHPGIGRLKYLYLYTECAESGDFDLPSEFIDALPYALSRYGRIVTYPVYGNTEFGSPEGAECPVFEPYPSNFTVLTEIYRKIGLMAAARYILEIGSVPGGGEGGGDPEGGVTESEKAVDPLPDPMDGFPPEIADTVYSFIMDCFETENISGNYYFSDLPDRFLYYSAVAGTYSDTDMFLPLPGNISDTSYLAGIIPTYSALRLIFMLNLTERFISDFDIDRFAGFVLECFTDYGLFAPTPSYAVRANEDFRFFYKIYSLDVTVYAVKILEMLGALNGNTTLYIASLNTTLLENALGGFIHNTAIDGLNVTYTSDYTDFIPIFGRGDSEDFLGRVALCRGLIGSVIGFPVYITRILGRLIEISDYIPGLFDGVRIGLLRNLYRHLVDFPLFEGITVYGEEPISEWRYGDGAICRYTVDPADYAEFLGLYFSVRNFLGIEALPSDINGVRKLFDSIFPSAGSDGTGARGIYGVRAWELILSLLSPSVTGITVITPGNPDSIGIYGNITIGIITDGIVGLNFPFYRITATLYYPGGYTEYTNGTVIMSPADGRNPSSIAVYADTEVTGNIPPISVYYIEFSPYYPPNITSGICYLELVLRSGEPGTYSVYRYGTDGNITERTEIYVNGFTPSSVYGDPVGSTPPSGRSLISLKTGVKTTIEYSVQGVSALLEKGWSPAELYTDYVNLGRTDPSPDDIPLCPVFISLIIRSSTELTDGPVLITGISDYYNGDNITSFVGEISEKVIYPDVSVNVTGIYPVASVYGENGSEEIKGKATILSYISEEGKFYSALVYYLPPEIEDAYNFSMYSEIGIELNIDMLTETVPNGVYGRVAITENWTEGFSSLSGNPGEFIPSSRLPSAGEYPLSGRFDINLSISAPENGTSENKSGFKPVFTISVGLDRTAVDTEPITGEDEAPPLITVIIVTGAVAGAAMGAVYVYKAGFITGKFTLKKGKMKNEKMNSASLDKKTVTTHIPHEEKSEEEGPDLLPIFNEEDFIF